MRFENFYVASEEIYELTGLLGREVTLVHAGGDRVRHREFRDTGDLPKVRA